MISWANDVCRIGGGNATLVHCFPDWFYRLFSLPFHLAVGMAWHFFFMWLSAWAPKQALCVLRHCNGNWI